LSRYFDTCRRLTGLYGGTVEKFIGDAVMAVWGAPVATEDDAERAVRAALDLVAAIPELEPALRARAGVFAGDAAVTLGAEGEGGFRKSRVAWEFEKYIDGLLENVWWHRGRCLAYGEGVAYWALAEMVRMRSRIAEEDTAEAALAKLQATLDEHAASADEREW